MSLRLSGLTLRSFAAGDEAAILDVVGQAFRGIEYLPRIRKGLSLSSPYFRPSGCFIAEEGNQVKGCIAVLAFHGRTGSRYGIWPLHRAPTR